MEIMEFRQRMIECALKGFDSYGRHFIDGCKATPAALGGDDMGIVYFSTLVHQGFGTTPTESVQIFIFTLLVSALIIGWLGALVAFRGVKQRVFVTLGFASIASIALVSHAGVYAASSAIAVAVIPCFIAIFRPKSILNPWHLVAVFLFAGILLGVTDFIRAYSGVPVLVFALTLLLFKRYGSGTLKLVAVVVFVIGAAGPKMYFASLFQDRDTFLLSQDGTYTPPLKRHLFWHTAYIGLGYTANDFGLVWSDAHAFDALEKRAPGTARLSAASEQVHKQLFIETIIAHPIFTLMNSTAKVGVLATMIVMFANLGLLVRGKFGLDPPIRLAFLTSTLMAASYSLLAIPSINYTTQLVVIAAMYGIFMIAAAIPYGIRKALVEPFGSSD